MQWCAMGVHGCWLIWLVVLESCVPQYHYHDQFAVHVVGSSEVVDELAFRHGFLNHGQVSALGRLSVESGS